MGSLKEETIEVFFCCGGGLVGFGRRLRALWRRYFADCEPVRREEPICGSMNRTSGGFSDPAGSGGNRSCFQRAKKEPGRNE